MNILLIQLKRIGDLVLTTPAIAAVREKFPGACVSLIVGAGSRELLPAIRGVDRSFIARGKIQDAPGWFTLARRKYDYCIDFTRNDRSGFLTLLSGARKRIAEEHARHPLKIRSLSYNVFVDSPVRELHTVDYHLKLLEPLGIRDASRQVCLGLPAVGFEQADRVMADAGIGRDFLLLHPGSARAEKFWEPERWAEIIDFAADRGFTSVLTSGRSPIEQAHIARIKTRARGRFVDLSGRIDLLTLGALIARARLLTTVDSAPVHLAAATQTPQVVLFGPTNPMHWRPRFSPALVLQGDQAAPLTEFSPASRRAAMNQISTQAVIDAMEALLAAPRAASV